MGVQDMLVVDAMAVVEVVVVLALAANAVAAVTLMFVAGMLKDPEVAVVCHPEGTQSVENCVALKFHDPKSSVTGPELLIRPHSG